MAYLRWPGIATMGSLHGRGNFASSPALGLYLNTGAAV
jgi:hypothetical protein